jgi:NADP-dependent 3-hydroxy acid dehydrogenase YdfG
MGLVIIIGVGPGISYGVARRFGIEGYRIGLIARREDRLASFAEQLKSEGIDAEYAMADVTDPDAISKALEQLNAASGQADMILYNPSGFSKKEILEQDWDTIKGAIDISAGGFFHLMKLVLPHYLERNEGRLFATGGGTALQGDAHMAALSVGKAAMRNLVQAFQQRVKGTNIHIAQVTVQGYVQPTDPKYNPDAIAELFWKLYNQPQGQFQEEILY